MRNLAIIFLFLMIVSFGVWKGTAPEEHVLYPEKVNADSSAYTIDPEGIRPRMDIIFKLYEAWGDCDTPGKPRFRTDGQFRICTASGWVDPVSANQQ